VGAQSPAQPCETTRPVAGARGYTDFVNRQVTTEYLDALIPTPED